jgi:hypothetical protein
MAGNNFEYQENEANGIKADMERLACSAACSY